MRLVQPWQALPRLQLPRFCSCRTRRIEPGTWDSHRPNAFEMRLHTLVEVGIIARFGVRPCNFGNSTCTRQCLIQVTCNIPRITIVRPRIAGGAKNFPLHLRRPTMIKFEQVRIFQRNREIIPTFRMRIVLVVPAMRPAPVMVAMGGGDDIVSLRRQLPRMRAEPPQFALSFIGMKPCHHLRILGSNAGILHHFAPPNRFYATLGQMRNYFSREPGLQRTDVFA